MLANVKEIAELARNLGTCSGLSQVTSEIDLLNVRLAENDLTFSHEELSAMKAALALLSGAILEMNLTVRTMLAEAGVVADHVG